MKDDVTNFPNGLKQIQEATEKLYFDQVSDVLVGSLLSTLVASKPSGKFLELGTGSGLSTAWMLQGMDKNSTLKTVDNEKELLTIAKEYLGNDERVEFIEGKGEKLILDTRKNSIDLIFADTWPGKYNHLEETLSLLNCGGIYVVDDMLPQQNWPKGHDIKADNLVEYLESREDLFVTKLNWSTGVIICTKKDNT